MRFRFASKKLERLYANESGAKKLPRAVVEAFFDVMAVISAARDERDFYALKSLHFEALSGDRKGQYSLRLNKQFRLIVTLERDELGNVVIVVEIVDYH